MVGAGRKYANLAYIKLGTGVGSGLMIDNEIYRGDGGMAAEVTIVSNSLGGAPSPSVQPL